jgi:subtilase family serine protease
MPQTKYLALRVAVGFVLCACVVVAMSQPSEAASQPLVRASKLASETAPAGAVALGSLQTTQNINLSVVLAPSDPSGLHSLLANLYNPRSPEFHQWLRPGQFMAKFGPSASEVSAVKGWLHGTGLTTTTASGFSVKVQATASRVASALGVNFERYRTRGGVKGYLTRSAPLVPTTLSGGEVQGILGLNTLTQFVPQSGALAGQVAPDAVATPHADGLTPCSGAATVAGSSWWTLDQLGAAYGIGSLLSAGQNGHGETIGVYELAPHSVSDVNAYESCFGLTNPVSTVAVDGGATASTTGTAEADLDIEQAATQAPGASVISYEGPSTIQGAYDIWNTFVSQDAAQVMSTSWGECELAAQSDGTIGSYSTLFQQAATQGQTVLAAAGDSGSEGCYTYNSSTSEQVTYPSSDAWVTAVGGTSLFFNGTETAWNLCQSGESISCANSHSGMAAGGGGMSRYEPRPSYQPNLLVWPVAQSCGTSCREVPDLSANSGVGMVIYANGSWGVGGGTSFAAPFMAGLIADKDTGCSVSTGVFTPALYALWSEGVYGTALKDITQGNTDMTGSNGGAFAAGSGDDSATGLGSPIASGLACAGVTSVQPSSSFPGSEVTVSGLGLEKANIFFGSTQASVVSASATAATVIVPSGSGSVSVSATSVQGNGSSTSLFAFTAPPPPPTVTSVSPNLGSTTVGTAVTITGTNFTGATAVMVGANAATGFTVDSSSSIAATFPGSAAGTVDVTVTTPGGTSAPTGADEFTYVQPPAPPTPPSSGYDLVGQDGGVFVFPTGQSGGFYGSLPGLGVHVNDIVGMVPSPDDKGYFLVGQDGGVFAFGDAPYLGSLPGLRLSVHDIKGIVPTSDNRGYFLVGQDGGVFAFGEAPFLGSLPGEGIHITDVVGIAATPSDRGYWVVAGNGTVYSFGNAPNFGSATGSASPVSGIASTPDGGGYWIVTQNGSVFTFGDAGYFLSLPALGVKPKRPIIGLVPTSDDKGYWLIGGDGGIFAFGDAPFVGSLPGLGIHITDIVGAVPTTL